MILEVNSLVVPSVQQTLGMATYTLMLQYLIKVYNNAWPYVGETLTELNVDNGTLFVDSSK